MAGAPKGGRDLVAQFAGHLANLLNGNDHLPETATVVEIRPFQLYEKVFRGLSANRRYLDGLVGLWSYPPPQEAEAAADTYFDEVLDRPIGRRSGKASSADNLRAAIAAAAAGPFSMSDTAELSTWKAMVDGPPRIRRFVQRSSLFEVSNLILKCLDAANRPYAEVLRLGLCPKDWLTGSEEVSVNTLKAANAFLKALRDAMNGDVARRPTPDELEAAFAAAPVPGSDRGADFARTTLGGAILARVAGQDITRLVSFELVESGLAESLADDGADELLPADEAVPILDEAVGAGVLDDDERRLLAAVLEGRPLADLMKSDLPLRRRLKVDHAGDLGAYVADLSSRLADFARRGDRSRP